MTCTDRRCVNGIVPCGRCNGWGRVNPKREKPYRTRHAPGWQIPEWAIQCPGCKTGYVRCGCTALTREAEAYVAGEQLQSV